MNRIRHIGRRAAALATLAGALLALTWAAPAALAGPVPPRHKYAPLPPRHTSQVHTVVIGGMPGWQIALIATGAALLAATAAVLLYRAWATRRHPHTATA